MEETNGQGAGCTAGAGRESRNIDDMWTWLWVKGICPTGEERDEEMEEGEDLKGVQPTQQEDER